MQDPDNSTEEQGVTTSLSGVLSSVRLLPPETATLGDGGLKGFLMLGTALGPKKLVLISCFERSISGAVGC